MPLNFYSSFHSLYISNYHVQKYLFSKRNTQQGAPHALHVELFSLPTAHSPVQEPPYVDLRVLLLDFDGLGPGAGVIGGKLLLGAGAGAGLGAFAACCLQHVSYVPGLFAKGAHAEAHAAFG